MSRAIGSTSDCGDGRTSRLGFGVSVTELHRIQVEFGLAGPGTSTVKDKNTVRRAAVSAPAILLRCNEESVRVRRLGLRAGGGGGRVQNHTVSTLQLWFVSVGHTAATVTDDDAARPAMRRHRVLLVTSEQSPEGAGRKKALAGRRPKKNVSTPHAKESERQNMRKCIPHRTYCRPLTQIAPVLNPSDSGPCEYSQGDGERAPAHAPSPRLCFARQSPASEKLVHGEPSEPSY